MLDVEFLSAPTLGEEFLIVENGSDVPVEGYFAGLPEGATFSVPSPGGPVPLAISYLANLDGGAIGNDIVLTVVVPEPAACGLLLISLAAVALRRR